MPKGSETTVKECHDCGQTGELIYRSILSNDFGFILLCIDKGPEWCSINHGVLLCDECCSVHLSLGRHISQIKSFKRSYWPPNQLNV